MSNSSPESPPESLPHRPLRLPPYRALHHERYHPYGAESRHVRRGEFDIMVEMVPIHLMTIELDTSTPPVRAASLNDDWDPTSNGPPTPSPTNSSTAALPALPVSAPSTSSLIPRASAASTQRSNESNLPEDSSLFEDGDDASVSGQHPAFSCRRASNRPSDTDALSDTDFQGSSDLEAGETHGAHLHLPRLSGLAQLRNFSSSVPGVAHAAAEDGVESTASGS